MIRWEEQTIDVSALKPFERNPRKITPAALSELKRRITENGYHQRLLATPDYRIIAGHQRLKVLKELGIEQIQILVPDRPLTDTEFARIVVQDNLDPLGTFDIDVLQADYAPDDLLAMGVPQDILRKIRVAERGLTDPNSVPDRPAKPLTVLGDMWLLGDHRIICGDSTNARTVETLLGGDRPHLMVTDPPYGVEYDATQARATSAGSAKGKVLNDDRYDWRQAWALFPGDVAYVWHASYFTGAVQESLEVCEFDIRASIIWNKSQLVMGRGHYHWKHEPCWYAVRKGRTGHWQGARDQSTVWDIDKPQKSETDHSTQKPIDCMRIPIENNSKIGDRVYDPFLGSGTTLIAAEMTGRSCSAIELNPVYVDVAILRWQAFTGGKAVHAVSGKEFGE